MKLSSWSAETSRNPVEDQFQRGGVVAGPPTTTLMTFSSLAGANASINCRASSLSRGTTAKLSKPWVVKTQQM